MNLLDDLIDESVRTSPRRPIMMQFDPSSGWIWRRWKGTIFSETWKSCVKNMLYASIIFFIYKRYPEVKDYLNGFGTLWGQLLSVTTFTLTFFVNQSYALWRKCYELSRRLQGRLHDIGMNLATHAARKVPTSPDETSTYTAASRQILELMSRYIRIFDLLTYASFTRSHRPILTPRGMRRLVERGLMTAQEREVLVDAAIPATQRHSAILMWMIRLFVEGRMSGHILGGDGFEQQTIEKFHVIRAQYGAIGDELQGRMPLAYAHVVQILVDLILWMYPVMAFSIGMSPVVAIAGTGLLTFSYQGLFDLAKQFLDPYDNENYGKGEDPLSVDTLIAETNAGSVRWMYGFEEMPFSQQKLRDGELYDYLLPVRGYTVDELTQMEEEKRVREREMEEQRIKEEQERLQREAEEAAAKAAQDDKMTDEDQDDNGAREVESSVDKNLNSANATAEERSDSLANEERPVHKITTLADGTVVSFKEDPAILSQSAPADINVSDPKPIAPLPAVMEGVAPYLTSLSRENVAQIVTNDDLSADNEQRQELDEAGTYQKEPGLEEGDIFDQQPLFDEASTSDEDVGGVGQVVAKSPSSEDYEVMLAESTTNPKVENLEVIEIMNTVPGNSLKEQQTEGEISGEEMELNVVSSSKLPSKGTTFGESITAERLDETMITKLVDQVIAELQNQSFRDKSSTGAEKIDGGRKPKTKPVEKVSKVDSSNEKKGKDLLTEEKKEPPARLTLDDYNIQVEKIMEAAKEELLETEAILKARPGADPLGWDYDAKQLAPSTDGSVVEEEVGREVSRVDDVDDAVDLDVLEMDKAEEIELIVDSTSDHPEAAVETGVGADVDTNKALPILEETMIDQNSITQDDSPEADDLQNTEVSELDMKAKVTDKVEPILVEQTDDDSNIVNGMVRIDGELGNETKV